MRHISLHQVLSSNMAFKDLSPAILKLISLFNVLADDPRAQYKLIELIEVFCISFQLRNGIFDIILRV